MADKPITKNTAWRWLAQLGEEVGIDLYPHRLRHTAGTLVEQFGSPAYRQALGIVSDESEEDATSSALLGHKSARISAQYNNIPLKEVRSVMEMEMAFTSVIQKH